jgi:hypothetical protein
MTRKEYEKQVKERLYACRGASKLEIDAEIERNKKWFFSYYEEAGDDFKHAIDLAVANFSMMV